MTGSIVIDHRRHAFYCWRHSKHYPWSKLNYCFRRHCPEMIAPDNLSWRTPALGLKVPLAARRRPS